jgi:hypothetical protein
VKNVFSRNYSANPISVGSLSENNISDIQIDGFSNKDLKKLIPNPNISSALVTISSSN